MKTTTTGAAAGAAVIDDLHAALDARATDGDAWALARQKGEETAAILAGLEAERGIVAAAMLEPLLRRGKAPRGPRQ